MASIIPLTPLSQSHKLFLRSPYAPHVLRRDRYLDEQWIGIGLSCILLSWIEAHVLARRWLPDMCVINGAAG
jgi:hypothetical protein